MPRNTQVTKQCAHCGVDFSVFYSRRESAKYCSRSCSDKHPRPHNTVRCRECGKEFAKKASHATKNAWGNFCGMACLASAKSRMYSGRGNPNFRGRNFDTDGYRIYVPSLNEGGKSVKLHHKVVFDTFGIGKIPKGVHVHHRNCNVLENSPRNLQLMTASDHKWLHKQYGVATLSAIQSGKVSASEAASWSDDQIRAETLLMFDIQAQSIMYKYFKDKYGAAPDLGSIAAIKPIRVKFVEVNELSETERGSGGFGSTGK